MRNWVDLGSLFRVFSVVRQKAAVLFIAACMLFFIPKLHATDYYVSSQSVWEARRTATYSPGDRILLQAGMTFNGQFRPTGSGLSGSFIELLRTGTGRNPIIVGGASVDFNSGVAVLLKDLSYWKISDVEITNPNGRAGVRLDSEKVGVKRAIYMNRLIIHDINGNLPVVNGWENRQTSGGIVVANGYTGTSGSRFDDVRIEDCIVYDIRYIGIQHTQRPTGSNMSSLHRTTNLKILNSFVTNTGHDGMVIRLVNGALVEGCRIQNVGLSRERPFAGLWLKYSTGSIIQHCEVSDVVDNGIDGQAFDFDLNTDGNVIQYNYSHDNEGGAILFCPLGSDAFSNGNVFRYNISQNDARSSIRLWCGGDANNNRIYNNTFYTSSTTPLQGVVQKSNNVRLNGNLVYNNIFFINSNASFYSGSGIAYSDNLFSGGVSPVGSNPVNGNPEFSNAGMARSGWASAAAYFIAPTSPAKGSGISISNNGGFDFAGDGLYANSPDSR